MDALGIIRDLLAHMQWADATIWSTVHRLGGEDAELRDRLKHLHGTQWAFLMIWRSQPVTFDPPLISSSGRARTTRSWPISSRARMPRLSIAQ